MTRNVVSLSTHMASVAPVATVALRCVELPDADAGQGIPAALSSFSSVLYNCCPMISSEYNNM